MEVEYEYTIDDAKAWSRYYVKNSPVFKKQINNMRLVYILFAVFLVAVTITFYADDDLLMALGLTFVTLFLAVYFFIFPVIRRKKVMQAALEENQKMLPNNKEKRKITITDETMTITKPAATSIFWWSLLEDVITYEKHLFILTRGFGAICVPERAFASEADFQQFVVEVKLHYKTAKTTK